MVLHGKYETAVELVEAVLGETRSMRHEDATGFYRSVLDNVARYLEEPDEINRARAGLITIIGLNQEPTTAAARGK